MNNDLKRWSDIKHALVEYRDGLTMSRFLTEADCRNARFAVDGALHVLENVAAVDAVEVTRCKDCAVPHNKWTGCPYMNGLIPPADHFCSYGE